MLIISDYVGFFKGKRKTVRNKDQDNIQHMKSYFQSTNQYQQQNLVIVLLSLFQACDGKSYYEEFESVLPHL